jgi:DHA2 family multidrug resistance protein
LKDWFGSTEIWIEATIAGLGFYLFIVHTWTADRPLVPEPRAVEEPNFVAGTC